MGDSMNSKDSDIEEESRDGTLLSRKGIAVEIQKSNRLNDNICGWHCGENCVAPCRCFQQFANAKWALVFLSFSNLVHQALANGLIGVTTSTLEKRFELRSTESGLIASAMDLGRCAVLFVAALLPFDVDKPRVIGWGLLVSGLAAMMFAVPHFTAPHYTYVDGDVLNYCGNVTEPDCGTSPLRNYLYWFFACFCLIGMGTYPTATYGVTYLDENVKKKNSTLYGGLYLAIGGLGPAIGFVFGGMTLELYTYPTEDHDDLTIDSSSYSWVGAWWVGYLVSGALLILSSIPLLLLPKYLPGTEKHRRNRNVETQRSHFESYVQNSKTSSACRNLSEIFFLLRNKPFILMVFGHAMNTGLIYGFNTFGAKYFESVFALTPFYASLVYGIAAIFASFGAQLTSGIVVKKFNLQVTGMLKFMIGTGIVSALCSIGFLVHCEDIDFAGGTVAYPGYENTAEPLSVSSSCNSNCSCTTDRYEPVCRNGIAYFSPCFAGCNTKLNETTYTDCNCAMDNVSHVNRDIIVSSEACDWKPCNMIYPFIIIVFICFFTSVLTIPTAVQVTLRCVPFEKRDIAMYFRVAFCHIAGIFPGRVLVGYVLDKACVAWSTECGEQGSCKVYKRGDIARNNTLLLLSQTTVCVMAYALVLITYKPVGETNTDATDAENKELDRFDHTDEKRSCDSV